MATTPSDLPVRFEEKEIDAIFAGANQCHLPGVAVGIGIGGVPVYRKGFGLASMDLPVILTSATRMRLGSITKHLAAFAFLMLCEEGRARIDDTVGRYLPELHPEVQKVTVRQLLGNNSGLRDATDLVSQFSGLPVRRVTTADLMSFYRDSGEANASPGITHIYNNGGWVILSVLMERVAEQSLEEILQSRVFKPIGMYDTLLRRWDSDFIPNSATSHGVRPDGTFQRFAAGGVDYAGAGGIASTIDDMLRWLAHMDAPTVGSAATWTLMKTPQKLANGISTRYGLGLSVNRVRGIDMIWHNGGVFGSNAQMVKIPGAGLNVVVLCNSFTNSAAGLADKILESCLPTLAWPGDLYTGHVPEGVFRSPSTGRALHLSRGGVSYYLDGEPVPKAALDGHFIPLTSDGKGTLRPCDDLFLELAFTPIGDASAPSYIKLTEFGHVDELLPVTRSVRPDVAAIVGRYHSAETGTEGLISATEKGVRLKMTGRFGQVEHALEYLADGVWSTRMLDEWILPMWGSVLFDSGGASFGFYTVLTRNVRFQRAA